jgi:DNA-directed RNA polymerase specialized sigma24 family protein
MEKNLDSVVMKKCGKGPKKTFQRLPWPRNSEPDENGNTVPLGIDVVAKENDIKKIVHKFFSVKDVEMEELLQEVYLAIIHKNTTKSACDSRKSSFGHYVYMIANNVCIGFVNRNKKHSSEVESIDHNGQDNERFSLDRQEFKLDRQETNENENGGGEDIIAEAENLARKQGKFHLARYIRATRQGVSSEVIKEVLSFGGIKMNNKSMKEIREQARSLAREMEHHLFIESIFFMNSSIILSNIYLGKILESFDFK